MNTTHHTEYLKLKSIFIKPARNAFISEAILREQWEGLNYLEQPLFHPAMDEYESFETKLQIEGVVVHHFPKREELTIDSVYCRDASIATDFGMIICNMGKEGRKGEPKAQKKVFEAKGISILGEIMSPGTLEGGDVAWLDKKTLAVGHTYRTNEEGIEQLKNLLEPRGVTVVIAEMPHYRGESDVFHLMSVFSPVDKDLAVVYSALMPIKFRNELISRGFKLVEVPDEEFDSMGCNVLATSPRTCLMVEGNPITKSRLLKAGCEVYSYKGDEISVKGGGGPTCLTRPLERFC